MNKLSNCKITTICKKFSFLQIVRNFRNFDEVGLNVQFQAISHNISRIRRLSEIFRISSEKFMFSPPSTLPRTPSHRNRRVVQECLTTIFFLFFFAFSMAQESLQFYHSQEAQPNESSLIEKY